MPPNQSSGILAVILGASVFPESSNFDENRAFYHSQADIKDYFSQENGLAIPKPNIFSLFDDSRSPAEQLTELARFLTRRLGELKNSNQPANTLLLYHVGHGLFTRGEQKYCLAVRSINAINESATSIRASDLASVILENARFLRRYLILDCCFSATIFKEFQSGPLNAVRRQIQHELPERGTALLCSSSAREASLSPTGRYRTMFSSALIRALRRGHPNCGPELSFSELGDVVLDNLRNEYPDTWVRPEVLSPDKRSGDIANIPLFPNPAYLETQRQVETKAAEAAEAAEAARQARERVAAAERERVAREQAEAARQAREKAKPSLVRRSYIVIGVAVIGSIVAIVAVYLSSSPEYTSPSSSDQASPSSPEQENALGDQYYSGRGVTQDYAQALSWYRKAADQGDTRSPSEKIPLRLIFG